MSTQRQFIQCDVFTSTPTKGNALAVILDAEGMSDADMASFARWTNLAETTFLFPPEHPDAELQGAHLHTDTRNAFCRAPHLGQLRCVATRWWCACKRRTGSAGVRHWSC